MDEQTEEPEVASEIDEPLTREELERIVAQMVDLVPPPSWPALEWQA